MAKPAKKKNPEIEPATRVRQKSAYNKCWCGAKFINGVCVQDHDALARESRKQLHLRAPLLAKEPPEHAIGVPWVERKIRTFMRMYSDLKYAKTLDRNWECPKCRERMPWGQWEYAGCITPRCYYNYTGEAK